MDKTLRNALVIGILLISFSVAFYFLFYIPNKQWKLENARKNCSLITRKALSEEERAKARKAWEDNNCENQQSGFAPFECITSKEKMNRTADYAIKTSQAEFDQCLREKGL